MLMRISSDICHLAPLYYSMTAEEVPARTDRKAEVLTAVDGTGRDPDQGSDERPPGIKAASHGQNRE
jgi:hypothetical protein